MRGRHLGVSRRCRSDRGDLCAGAGVAGTTHHRRPTLRIRYVVLTHAYAPASMLTQVDGDINSEIEICLVVETIAVALCRGFIFALMALDAVVHIRRPEGQRSSRTVVPVDDVFLLPCDTSERDQSYGFAWCRLSRRCASTTIPSLACAWRGRRQASARTTRRAEPAQRPAGGPALPKRPATPRTRPTHAETPRSRSNSRGGQSRGQTATLTNGHAR
jgi:hypothetical protein